MYSSTSNLINDIPLPIYTNNAGYIQFLGYVFLFPNSVSIVKVSSLIFNVFKNNSPERKDDISSIISSDL